MIRVLIPLIVFNHEVKVILNHRYNSDHHVSLIVINCGVIIYLDTMNIVAQVSHEYLIEQVQETNFGITRPLLIQI